MKTILMVAVLILTASLSSAGPLSLSTPAQDVRDQTVATQRSQAKADQRMLYAQPEWDRYTNNAAQYVTHTAAYTNDLACYDADRVTANNKIGSVASATNSLSALAAAVNLAETKLQIELQDNRQMFQDQSRALDDVQTMVQNLRKLILDKTNSVLSIVADMNQ